MERNQKLLAIHWCTICDWLFGLQIYLAVSFFYAVLLLLNYTAN
jgi:hypothetical protein